MTGHVPISAVSWFDCPANFSLSSQPPYVHKLKFAGQSNQDTTSIRNARCILHIHDQQGESMVRRIGLIAFLAVACLVAAGKQSAAGQNRTSKDDVATYSSIAPPFVIPGKDSFVTREGDPFVVVVTATCLLEDNSDAQFELLSSSPDFVHVSGAYRKESRANGYAEGLGVVYVTPQIGDAGKYVVSLQVKACSGKVERVITFKVNVKQARQD
jgi:hypothetical protein